MVCPRQLPCPAVFSKAMRTAEDFVTWKTSSRPETMPAPWCRAFQTPPAVDMCAPNCIRGGDLRDETGESSEGWGVIKCGCAERGCRLKPAFHCGRNAGFSRQLRTHFQSRPEGWAN